MSQLDDKHQLTHIEKAIFDRRTTRAFLKTPVQRSDIEAILLTARQAPSGANLQPGKFHVLTDSPLSELSQTLVNAVKANRPVVSEYSYFPEPLPAHLKKKQVKAGAALYSALGINKRDHDSRSQQFVRNFRFFDAPVGLVVTIDRNMGKGCFMDLGLSLMSLFMSAHSRRLACSGIGALAKYGDLVHESLHLPANELVVCGIALGYADEAHSVNKVNTERDELDSYAFFYS